MIKTATKLVWALTVCLAIFTASSAQAQQRIEEIRVEGAQRIEPSTILSYSGLSVGDQASREVFDNSLKALFSTGLFADVGLRMQGEALVIKVVENPIINQIAFEGNRRIEDNELIAEIQLRPRQVFTKSKVQDDVSRLYQVYRRSGRFSVDIEPKVIKLDQNRVDLVFEMNEGDVTEVSAIRFVGNKRFDDATLRSEISTKESAWYRFLSSDDRYDPDRLAYDQELLRRFYLKNGYADFTLTSAVAELSNDRENFYVTFTLEEGERYKVGDVTINSRLRNFDTAILDKDLKIESGDWYDGSAVQDAANKMTSTLGDNQYAFVDVRPDINRNREERTIDLTFDIDESPRIFVERINVNGNVRTIDKVVRRELELVEGDPFNRTKLNESERNVRELDFFETVEMDVSRGSAPDKTVIDVNVAEKSTGELSIGAGFSTNDGPLGDFRITERNLLGKGQQLSLGMLIAAERSQFDLGFTEPHFLDRDMSAGVDVFHTTRDFQQQSSFDQTRTGGGVRFGYPWSKKWRQTLRYRWETNEITNVDANTSRFIRDQEGKRDISALSQRLTYDGRDSALFPTDGLFYWLDTEISGLGGDSQYVLGRTGASYYIPVADQWTLNFMGEVGAMDGYGDENVVINERFLMGGDDFRGFERSGVGPRDVNTGDALGGNMFYLQTTELSFPLGLPDELGLRGHLFHDIGSLYEVDETGAGIADDDSVRLSAGFSISWRSPFGPVRADFGFPYVKEDYDEVENFRINFGTRF